MTEVRGAETFGSVLDRHRGIGPGFDLLRVALALAIFIGHAKWVGGAGSLGGAMTPGVAWSDHVANLSGSVLSVPEKMTITTPIRLYMVPAFFALSGFLVTGSALRLQRTSTFLANRALRIFPALATEVALSALVLGPVFTNLPLPDYFSAYDFWRYFGNVIGEVWMLLPGVFTDSPATRAVNVNLWTLPSEFWCYILTMVLMLTGVLYRRPLATAVTIAGLAAVIVFWLGSGYSLTPQGSPHLVHVIVMHFFLGMLAFLWRDRVPKNVWLFLASAVASYLLLTSRSYIYFAMPFVTYSTLYVGMVTLPRIKLLQSGDYSYGIYLFGFPLTQAVAVGAPWFQSHPVSLTVVAGLLTAGFSYASWHVIEKRALQLRRKLPERWFPTSPKARAKVAETAA